MKIIKPQSLSVLHKPYSFLGQHYLSVAAIGFFRLGTANARFLSENQQWPHVIASLPAGLPLDDVMSKPHAEALLLGSAHAPQQQACTALQVQLRLDDAQGRASISKCLCISGDREWRAGWPGGRKISKPTPFVSMPLNYRRAFGGPRQPVNPVGCGQPRWSWLSPGAHGAMPNIAYPEQTTSAAWRRRVAAGFGPIPIGNRARRRKFGSYGRQWQRHDAPGFARDIDWSVFNMAPPDQWATDFFEGGEHYHLGNLHPQHAELSGELPLLAARAFILEPGQVAEQATEVPLRMDTVWFLPDHELGIVIYHGRTEISDSDALNVEVLMLGYEEKNVPKSLQHYHEVMHLRLDPATAMLHVFNESQLASARSPAELAQRQLAQQQAEQAVLARSQQRIDLLDGQYWAARGSSPPAGHRPAQASLPPLGIMSAQTATEGDFDLSEIVTKAKALAAAAAQKGKEAMARIPPLPARPADLEKQLAQALERAAVPAYDLLPPGETGSDPLLATMLARLPAPESAADARHAEKNAAARSAIMKLPALRRQSRRAAPKLVLPGLPYASDVASALGRQIQQWLQAGICLAGRDLAGASLVGVDFSGADLRETMFDGADLSAASFTGANLQGAVLVGALLDGADFSRANLRQANLCASSGSQICFAGADLTRAQALDANWPRANLRGATLRRLLGIKLALTGAVLDQADASKATLFDLHADDSSWQHARLQKTVLLGASLQRSNFTRAQLNGSVLNAAQLQQSQWDHATLEQVQGGAKSIWNGASMVGMVARKSGFHGADLAHLDARQAQFLQCDFGKADLRWAQFDDALLSKCSLFQSDLRLSSARAAEFYQCLCRKSDFSGAQLHSAIFSQCEQTEAVGIDGTTAAARIPA